MSSPEPDAARFGGQDEAVMLGGHLHQQTSAETPVAGPRGMQTLEKDEQRAFVPKETAAQRIVKVEDYQEGWKLQEPLYQSNTILQDPCAQLLTSRYDKSDSKIKGRKRWEHARVTTYALDNKLRSAVTFLDSSNATYGYVDRPEGAALDDIVKSSFSTNTQRPSLRIHVKRSEDAPEVTCHIFPDMLMGMRGFNDGEEVPRDMDNPCILIQSGDELPTNWSETIPALSVRTRSKELSMTFVCLRENAKPIFTGITPQDLRKIQARGKADEEIEETHEQVIALLANSKYWCVNRLWFEGSLDTAREFNEWTQASWTMCWRFGYNWFYRAQALDNSSDIYSEDMDLAALEMPRWMALKSKVQIQNGVEIGPPIPVQCSSFHFNPGNHVCPTPEDAAFELRLGTVRNAAYQSYVLSSAIQKEGFEIEAVFKQHPQQPGLFVVECRTHDGSILNSDRHLRPRVDCRLRIQALRPPFDGDEEAMENADGLETDNYTGIISEDIFNSKAELVAIVRGPIMTTVDNMRWVRIMLTDDPTPANRWRSAIETIASKSKQATVQSEGEQPRHRRRVKGVDLAYLVLRAPPTMNKTASLADELEDDNYRPIRNFVVHRSSLNVKQQLALDRAMRSQTGVTLVQGPPGCGKTRTVAAIAHAHIIAGRALLMMGYKGRGRQILACAPSNNAVDAMLEIFVTGNDHLVKGLEIVRFRGALLRKRKQKTSLRKQGDEQMSGAPHADASAADNNGVSTDGGAEEAAKDEEMQAACWDLASEMGPFGPTSHAEYGFYAKRLAWIRRTATRESHQLHGVAVQYLEYQNMLKSIGYLRKLERRQLRADIADAEEILTEFYLDKVVDIVFATNSSSAHMMLSACFSPKVLISDEAATDTIPDIATPMAVYYDTLEAVILSGDVEQLQPVILSKNCNEFFESMQVSLFKSVYSNGMYGDDIIELNVQHRMHPELSDPISRLFYKSKLVDHQSVVTRYSAKWATLEAALSGLKPAWNGRRRLAMDVSGRNVRSGFYNQTASSYNEAEGDLAVDLLRTACMQEPLTPEGKIEPEDFLIITPYSGQAQYIRYVAAEAGLIKPGHRPKISSTRAIQGEEAPFVILSFTKNVPDCPLELGFVVDKHLLNVGMSRPQECLIMLGNFEAWRMQAVRGLNRLQPSNFLTRTSSHGWDFGRLVRDCHEHDDIISRRNVVGWLNSRMNL